MSIRTFNIAVIAGDGIGKEVVPEGILVLEAAAKRFGFRFAWQCLDWSCEAYIKTGRMMPPDGIEQLGRFDAIFDVLRPTERQAGMSEAQVEALIAERTQVKKARNFKRSDEIRAQLLEAGVVLEDTKEGVRWKRK